MKTKKRMQIMPVQCATCPFRDDVDDVHRQALNPTIDLILSKASRICHCTGSNNAFHKRTGKPEMLCRGARDFQLKMLYAMGFLSAATDAAWEAKCQEMGIAPDTHK